MNQVEGRFVSLSRAPQPVDEVDPKHAEIHSDLEAWGKWSRERRARLECGSGERAYRPRNGNIDMGWEHNPPESAPPRPPNPLMVALDRAILGLPDLHRTAFRMHYKDLRSPVVICRKLALRFVEFGPFMATGRNMVMNLLHRNAR